MSGQGLGESGRETQRHRTFDRRSYLKTLGATGSGLALGGLGLSETEIESARAAPTVIDDFEDGDLSEYSFDRGSSGASVVSSPAFNGSAALEISGTNTEMISTSDLSNYPSAGDTFSYWVRGTGGADDINLTYGVQDHDNRYFVRVDFANDDLILYRYENANSTLLKGKDPSLSEDTWYEVEVDWGSDGTHVVTLYDSSGSQLAQLSEPDSTWSSGGIGYDAYLGSSGGSVYFDYVTMKSGDGGGGTGSESPNGPDVSGGGLVVDNFEDGDLAEYTVTESDSGAVELVSSPTLSGSTALSVEEGSDLTTEELYSTEGLETYPSAGVTFSFWFQFENSVSNPKFLYGLQDLDNTYVINVDDGIHTEYIKGGTYYTSNGGTASLNTGEWYRATVTWKRDGTHSATLYDSADNELATDSTTESTWTSGGVGFRVFSNSSSVVYLDSVVVESRDDSGAGVVVDNFEDGDLSEYSFDRGSSGASVVSSPTFDGSAALEISGTNTEMIKTTGLPNEPEAGDVFSYWVRGTGGADDINLTYGVQDHTNRYFVRVDFANDNLRLYRYEGGTSYELDKQTTGFTLSEDVWYEVEVDWRKNGRHIVTLDAGQDRVTVEETDTTWTRGGIGYDAYLGSGGTVYVDHVTKNKCRPTDAGKVVDDFDDGDLGEYTVVRGSASTTSSPTYFGTNSLEISGTDTELVSTSGLPRYPSAGDRFRARVRATGGASTAKFLYGVQDGNVDERYAITIDFVNDDVGLHYENGSTTTTLAEDTMNCILTENEWFRIEVDWRTDGTQTVSLCNDSEDRLTRISGTDTTLSSGGVGCTASLASSGGTVYFDHVLVDGLNEELDSLANTHGGIDYKTYEQLSDKNGDRRMKVTYHCGDGTTYDVTHREKSDEKLRQVGVDFVSWQRVPTEDINRHERRMNHVKGRLNGGAF